MEVVSEMKYVEQLGILFGVCLAGYALSRLSPVPVPASICSMLLLLGLLMCGLLKVETIADTADFLLSVMAVFFVPSGVAIMAHVDFLKGRLLLVCAICAVTMLATFAAAAAAAWGAKQWERKREVG